MGRHASVSRPTVWILFAGLLALGLVRAHARLADVTQLCDRSPADARDGRATPSPTVAPAVQGTAPGRPRGSIFMRE